MKYISGATIQRTGEPSVILNVQDIFESSSLGAIEGVAAPVDDAAQVVEKRVLVVDDSITTRTLEKNILESAGYLVQTAVSGENALEKALEGSYNLFVVDLDMPGISGFELIKRLRKSKKFHETPVIIVSSRSKDEEIRRGIEVGANAYIVKSRFDQTNLLDTVKRLIGR
jgi:two-component system chemotaxis sensor kinase CheA